MFWRLISFSITFPSSPTLLLTPIASLKIINEKVKTTKNNGLNPWFSHIIVVSAATIAECVLGIPPVTIRSLILNSCLDLIKRSIIFISCEILPANKTDKKILLVDKLAITPGIPKKLK
jgi:hypothetical protein